MVVKIEVFTAPTCPYSPMALEVVEEAKKDLGDSIEIEKVDIMQHREKAVNYGLEAVPAVAMNGVVKFIGAPGKEELMAAIKEELKTLDYLTYNTPYDDSYINNDGFSENPNVNELEYEKDVDGLIHALNHPDVFIRRNSIKALSKLKDKKAIPALNNLLNDNDALVRKFAKRALDKFESECPECKFTNIGATFCQQCGYDLRKIEENSIDKKEINTICTNCGFKNMENAKFCSGCGNKLESFQNKDNVGIIDVNHDSEDKISSLPNIGSILAKKAIKIRESKGGFESVEDFCLSLELKPHIAKNIESLIICNPIEKPKDARNSRRVVDF